MAASLRLLSIEVSNLSRFKNPDHSKIDNHQSIITNHKENGWQSLELPAIWTKKDGVWLLTNSLSKLPYRVSASISSALSALL